MNAQAEFNEEFGDIMLNGISSTSTYIPLRQNKKQGINVAIRPWVTRLNRNVVFFGAKLRVGFTLDSDGDPVKNSVNNMEEQERVLRLRNFCKGFAWLRESQRRFSTIVGFGFAASQYDGDAAFAAIEEDDLVAEFVNRIERLYKQYNDGVKFTNKTRIVAALDAAWRIKAESVFTELPQTTQLPDEVVGNLSKLLNQAQDSYNENVVSFSEKVVELAATAAEEEGTNAE